MQSECPKADHGDLLCKMFKAMSLPDVQLFKYILPNCCSKSDRERGDSRIRLCRGLSEFSVCITGRTVTASLDIGSQVVVLTEDCFHQWF